MAVVPASDGWRVLPPDASADAQHPSRPDAPRGGCRRAAGHRTAARRPARFRRRGPCRGGGLERGRRRDLVSLRPVRGTPLVRVGRGDRASRLDRRLARAGLRRREEGRRGPRGRRRERHAGVRVPRPADAEWGGPFAVEVRYQTPGVRGAWELETFVPPRIRSAASLGPARWRIAFPRGTVPLVADATTAPEQRWRWSGWLPRPTAATAAPDLDRWLRQGSDAEDAPADDGGPAVDGEVLAFRQDTPGPVAVARVPRAGLTVGCSLAVLAAGVVLRRLPRTTAGVLSLLLAGGIAMAATLLPQATAEAASAASPGLVGAVALLSCWPRGDGIDGTASRTCRDSCGRGWTPPRRRSFCRRRPRPATGPRSRRRPDRGNPTRRNGDGPLRKDERTKRAATVRERAEAREPAPLRSRLVNREGFAPES